MVNSGIKTKTGKGYLAGFMLAFFMFLSVGFAQPTVSVDEISITGASDSVAAGTNNSYTIDLSFEDVNTTQGATVQIKGQENVSTIEVFLNGTSCESATVGLWDAYPFDCGNAISDSIVSGAAEVVIKNTGSDGMQLGAELSVRYKQNSQVADTSDLATKSDLASNTSAIRDDIGSTNDTLHTKNDKIWSDVNTSRDAAQAANTTADEINTTINSQSWKDSIASAVWSATTRTLTSLKQSIIELA